MIRDHHQEFDQREAGFMSCILRRGVAAVPAVLVAAASVVATVSQTLEIK